MHIRVHVCIVCAYVNGYRYSSVYVYVCIGIGIGIGIHIRIRYAHVHVYVDLYVYSYALYTGTKLYKNTNVDIHMGTERILKLYMYTVRINHAAETSPRLYEPVLPLISLVGLAGLCSVLSCTSSAAIDMYLTCTEDIHMYMCK